MTVDTSFVLAPVRAPGYTQYCSSRVCSRFRCNVRRRSPRKLLMESSQLETSVSHATAEEIVRDIWNKCEEAKFTSWLPYFDESAIYHDTLYPDPFVGKSEIAKHLKNMEVALPSNLVFVLDDLAVGSDRVGARWHAETSAGVQIPFSRGASMYSFVRKDGNLLIREAWDFPETPLKVAGIILPLLRGASAVLSLFSKQNSNA